MNGKRANPDDIGNLQCALQGIQEQPGADATALPFAMHGKPGQNKKRYRMARHAFNDARRRVSMANLTYNNRVEPYNRLVA